MTWYIKHSDLGYDKNSYRSNPIKTVKKDFSYRENSRDNKQFIMDNLEALAASYHDKYGFSKEHSKFGDTIRDNAIYQIETILTQARVPKGEITKVMNLVRQDCKEILQRNKAPNPYEIAKQYVFKHVNYA
jgi:hypothetical protein